MDTKSKNSRFTLPALFALVVSLSLLMLTAADVYQNREYLQKDSYFQSENFNSEVRLFVELVKDVHVDFAGYERKTPEEKLGKATVEQFQREREDALREVRERLESEYAHEIENARNASDTKELDRLVTEQAARLKKALEKETANWDRQFQQMVAEKDAEYEERKNSLALRTGSFKYYVRDNKTGKVYTNMSHEPSETEVSKNARYAIRFPENSYQKYGEFADINRTYQLSQWSGIFYVPKSPEGYSQIHADAVYFDSKRERLLGECALLTVTLLVTALLLWYLKLSRAAAQPIVVKSLALFRRIPLDIRIIMLLPIGVAYLALIFNLRFFFFFLPIDAEHFFTLGIISLFTAYLLLQALEAWHMYLHPGSLREQWQRSLFVRQKVLLRESYTNRSLFFKVSLLFILTVGFGMSVALGLVAMVKASEELFSLSFLYGLFYLATVVPYVLRRLGLMNRIMLGASEMSAGNLDATIEKIRKGNLSNLAHSLNNIKLGLKSAMEEQMKSERMKSELITNVSHDLKTPLTSIINYVDLLKRENLTADEIKSYVDVLDRKTARLRVLIDDLFDAAKMSSGAVELHIEQVNVASLLNQAIAEFSEKIEQSSLTFRVNVEQPKIVAPLDGKKTWRVFENLIGNALKYSLPNTRVLIDLYEKPGEVIMTIKNVSAYEIDFDAQELFERFKRADQSRNTEGSGLGLAIAKSIVELQGGRLSIEIDGDYFKVMVVFRKNA
ncbi:histidine kinase dimerization/phospho-acceptor domain-containing protein [Brevibacillus agri]|uniref:sensor histidine kinase n=1 Tax=Brevibacillus TaxID=55080 RepID=UPI0003F58BBB|nr:MULTISPECIES: HAMP domain-containing sensor histidine kinase [Brevibacillus]MBG9566711.1 histidine kinase [Brevibacillus agri]QHZ54469.1 GHKL domain-containing protein [Brevibacillus sp. NSP2.1]